MLIILDRDGVINYESCEYIKSPDEWIPIPGSLEAIAALKQAGHQVAVATNQSGIARGLYSEATLAEIHQKMHQLLSELGAEFDAVYYCPHHPDDCCDCRKPQPGLLTKIGVQFAADLNKAIVVGDSWRDLEAAKKVGARRILVKTGNGVQTQLDNSHQLHDVTVLDSLSNILNVIKEFVQLGRI